MSAKDIERLADVFRDSSIYWAVCPDEYAQKAVRDILKALREPSEEMLQVVRPGDLPTNKDNRVMFADDWRAAIDTLLAK